MLIGTETTMIHVAQLTSTRVLTDHPDLADLHAQKSAALAAQDNAETIPAFRRRARYRETALPEVERSRPLALLGDRLMSATLEPTTATPCGSELPSCATASCEECRLFGEEYAALFPVDETYPDLEPADFGIEEEEEAGELRNEDLPF